MALFALFALPNALAQEPANPQVSVPQEQVDNIVEAAFGEDTNGPPDPADDDGAIGAARLEVVAFQTTLVGAEPNGEDGEVGAAIAELRPGDTPGDQPRIPLQQVRNIIRAVSDEGTESGLAPDVLRIVVEGFLRDAVIVNVVDAKDDKVDEGLLAYTAAEFTALTASANTRFLATEAIADACSAPLPSAPTPDPADQCAPGSLLDTGVTNANLAGEQVENEIAPVVLGAPVIILGQANEASNDILGADLPVGPDDVPDLPTVPP